MKNTLFSRFFTIFFEKSPPFLPKQGNLKLLKFFCSKKRHFFRPPFFRKKQFRPAHRKICIFSVKFATGQKNTLFHFMTQKTHFFCIFLTIFAFFPCRPGDGLCSHRYGETPKMTIFGSLEAFREIEKTRKNECVFCCT